MQRCLTGGDAEPLAHVVHKDAPATENVFAGHVEQDVASEPLVGME